jgi:hypothetical protein
MFVPSNSHMRSVSRVPAVVATVFFTVALAGCDASSVHRPMGRSEQYRTATADYKTATVLASETDKEGNRAWRLPLPATSRVNATVSGRAHMDITVNYTDEAEPRLVHPPEDYTTNLEVRVKGSTLYVYRAVSGLRPRKPQIAGGLACRSRGRASTTGRSLRWGRPAKRRHQKCGRHRGGFLNSITTAERRRDRRRSRS